MKAIIYLIDHPAPETLSENASLNFRHSLNLDALNPDDPKDLQDAIDCAEHYRVDMTNNGDKCRAWIAQDGKTIWKSWQ